MDDLALKRPAVGRDRFSHSYENTLFLERGAFSFAFLALGTHSSIIEIKAIDMKSRHSMQPYESEYPGAWYATIT